MVEYITVDLEGKAESLWEEERTVEEVFHVEWEAGPGGRGDGKGGGRAHRERVEYTYREIMGEGVVVEEEGGTEDYVHVARRKKTREGAMGEQRDGDEEEEEEELWEQMESTLPARFFERENEKEKRGRKERGPEQWEGEPGSKEGEGEEEGEKEGGEEEDFARKWRGVNGLQRPHTRKNSINVEG